MTEKENISYLFLIQAKLLIAIFLIYAGFNYLEFVGWQGESCGIGQTAWSTNRAGAYAYEGLWGLKHICISH